MLIVPSHVGNLQHRLTQELHNSRVRDDIITCGRRGRAHDDIIVIVAEEEERVL